MAERLTGVEYYKNLIGRKFEISLSSSFVTGTIKEIHVTGDFQNEIQFILVEEDEKNTMLIGEPPKKGARFYVNPSDIKLMKEVE